MNTIIVKTIEYLNASINGKFEPNFPVNGELLQRLIDLGYSFEDFKLVIDKKVIQWTGTKYQEFIRPTTLFGNKFESYLNEQPRITKSNIERLAESVRKAQRTDWRLDNKR